MANNWQEDELLLTLHLYHRTSFGKLHKTNPEIIKLANIIGRSPSAVAMKACNFASLDPALSQKGLTGASNADKALWNEFTENSVEIAEKAERLFEERVEGVAAPKNEINEPKIKYDQTESVRETKVRLVQTFFRRAILINYNYRCAISGLAIPELLVASHIIPWSVSESRRADPTNGIALNALYDKAFDRCLISFDENFQLMLSEKIKSQSENKLIQEYFLKLEGKELEMPSKSYPDKKAFETHRQNMCVATEC